MPAKTLFDDTVDVGKIVEIGPGRHSIGDRSKSALCTKKNRRTYVPICATHCVQFFLGDDLVLGVSSKTGNHSQHSRGRGVGTTLHKDSKEMVDLFIAHFSSLLGII